MLNNCLSRYKLQVALLIILVLIVYSISLGNGFVSDDIASILQNPQVQSFSSVTDHIEGPLRPLLYWSAFKIGGYTPLWFRLINILFHLGSVITLFFILVYLYTPRVALIACSIFAVHPILSEAIVWISGGSYSQATFFILLSFLLYLRSPKKIKFYILSLASYLIALSSQPIALAYLAFLTPYQFLFEKGIKNLMLLIPYIILSIPLVLVNLGTVSSRTHTLQTAHYQELGINNPLLVFPVSISNYLTMIFWPKDLTLYHSEIYLSGINFTVSLIITLVFLALLFFSFKKNKPLFFWLSFFIINLIPTFIPAIFSLLWIVAERYLYLASIGIFVSLALVLDKYIIIPRYKSYIIGLITLIVLFLATRTIIRILDWKSEDTLWIATGKTSPSSPNNHNNLGDVYSRQGDRQRALKEFQTAIALKPNYGDAYHNLANTYQELGNDNQALENYNKALYYNPNLWQSYQNIAAIYFSRGRYDLAIENINKAINIIPTNSVQRLNLGIVYLKMGDKQRAKDAFSSVLQNDPQSETARLGLIEANK